LTPAGSIVNASVCILGTVSWNFGCLSILWCGNI